MADGYDSRRLEHPDDDIVFVRQQSGGMLRVPFREFTNTDICYEKPLSGRSGAPAKASFVRPPWQTAEDAAFIDAVLLRGTLHERLRVHAISKGAGRLGLRPPVSRPKQPRQPLGHRSQPAQPAKRARGGGKAARADGAAAER